MTWNIGDSVIRVNPYLELFSRIKMIRFIESEFAHVIANLVKGHADSIKTFDLDIMDSVDPPPRDTIPE
jgi:hypothetical protein